MFGPEPEHPFLRRCYSSIEGCQRCGQCCMAFNLIPATAVEAERLGREFFTKGDGEYLIRRIMQPWVSAGLGGKACVFLFYAEGEYKCTVQDEKPHVCSAWSCSNVFKAACADYGVSQRLQANTTRASKIRLLADNYAGAILDRRGGNYARRMPHTQWKEMCALIGKAIP